MKLVVKRLNFFPGSFWYFTSLACGGHAIVFAIDLFVNYFNYFHTHTVITYSFYNTSSFTAEQALSKRNN